LPPIANSVAYIHVNWAEALILVDVFWIPLLMVIFRSTGAVAMT
jgi:hypothetical protein